MRIAVGGLQHETNRFAPGTADLDAFAAPGGWPRLARGPALLHDLPTTATPTAGALEVFADRGVEVVPLLWALALPSGPVEHAAYETLRDEMLARLAQAGAVDGIFLELHGAMVTTEIEDGEGDLLGALRARAGPDMPVAASLDAHANLSPIMVAAADHLDAYRTYPHVDMARTGARAAERLLEIVRRGRPFAKAFRRVPFLIDIAAQSTLDEPMAGLVAACPARAAEVPGGALTQTFGFPLADVTEAGPAIVAYAEDQSDADALAQAALVAWIAAEPRFGVELLSPEAAVRAADAAAGPGGPVVVADVQDNPGGGGAGDTTGLLQALLAADAAGALHHRAVVVHVKDEAAVRRAVAAGVGGRMDGPLGGSEPAHGTPVTGTFDVTALGSGAFTGEGPMYRGNAIVLGPVALLERGQVAVIVAGRAMQASEPGLPKHLGLDPAAVPILVVKSSVHFRGAYQPIAREILLARAPGRVVMDLHELTFRHATRPPARTGAARSNASPQPPRG